MCNGVIQANLLEENLSQVLIKSWNGENEKGFVLFCFVFLCVCFVLYFILFYFNFLLFKDTELTGLFGLQKRIMC